MLKELALFMEKEYKVGQNLGYIFQEFIDVELTELPKTLPNSYKMIKLCGWKITKNITKRMQAQRT